MSLHIVGRDGPDASVFLHGPLDVSWPPAVCIDIAHEVIRHDVVRVEPDHLRVVCQGIRPLSLLREENPPVMVNIRHEISPEHLKRPGHDDQKHNKSINIAERTSYAAESITETSPRQHQGEP